MIAKKSNRAALQKVRETLASLLKGGDVSATALSEAIGRSKDYVRDFLTERKQSIAAVDLTSIEIVLRLEAGTLTDLLRTPALVETFDPDEPDPGFDDRGHLDSTVKTGGADLPPGAILEADVRVGMGGGGFPNLTEIMAPDGNSYAAESVRDWWRLPEHVTRGRFRVAAERVRCFEAVGDSMSPTVIDGDIVFVDIGHRMPSPAGIYALSDILGGVVLKRLEISTARTQDEISVRILSDNPKHTPEERLLDEITIVGRYLGRLTSQ